MHKIIQKILFSTLLILATTGARSQEPGQSEIQTNTLTKTGEVQSFDEYNDVAQALQPYITAAKTGDGKLSRTAFFDHAHIVGSYQGKFKKPGADEFAKGISKGGPSPEVKHHIAWVDISGPAAAAKVEFINWRGNRFTDFFVLYKHEGKWKISGKVYNSHSNN